MKTKKCRMCGETKPHNKFRNCTEGAEGKQAYCRPCCQVHRDSCRVRNLAAWKEYLLQRYGSEVACGACGHGPLRFFSGVGPDSAVFDHRNGGSEAIKGPSEFLRNRVCNDRNIRVWESCDFGILCNDCNRMLPTNYRKRMERVALLINNIDKLRNYVFRGNLRDLGNRAIEWKITAESEENENN